MFLKHSKVKFKILLTQLLAIIPFLLFIFILIDLWYDTRRSLILQENLTKASLLASNLYNTFDYLTAVSTTVSNKEMYNLLDKSGYLKDKTALKKALQAVADGMPPGSSVSMFDAQGNTIETSITVDPNNPPVNIKDRDYFQKVMTTGKAAASGPFAGRFTGSRVVIVASPIKPEEKTIGVIVASLNLKEMKKEFEKAIPQNGHHILIIGHDGNIIMELHQPFPDENTQSLLKNNTFVTLALRGQQSVIDNEKLPTSDKPVLGVSVPVANDTNSWAVLSYDDFEYIYLPIIKTQGFLWILILASILFSLTAISYILRKIKIVY